MTAYRLSKVTLNHEILAAYEGKLYGAITNAPTQVAAPGEIIGYIPAKQAAFPPSRPLHTNHLDTPVYLLKSLPQNAAQAAQVNSPQFIGVL